MVNLLNVYGTPLTPAISPQFSLGGGSGLQGHPGGIAFDALGNLYVIDFAVNNMCSGGTVDVFNPPVHACSHTAFTISTGTCNATALAFDHQGNLWVADTENGCPGCTGCGALIKYTPPFPQYATCGSCAGSCATATWDSGVLAGPAGIAFDRAGNMYVAQESINDVEVWSASQVANASGCVRADACHQSAYPRAFLCVEEHACNCNCNSIVASTPTGVAIDVQQRLFVGYRDNGLIGVYNPPFGTNDDRFPGSPCDRNVKPAFQIPAPGNLLTAGFMVFDTFGNLYVPYAGDTGVGPGGLAIFIPPFSKSSAPVFVLTSGLNNPYGIAFGR